MAKTIEKRSGSIVKKRRTHKERTDLSDRKMLEACEQLILEVGTQNTTLKEVGERAGYSRGLANARFGSKETLFLRVAQRCRELWFEEVTEASGDKKGLAAFLSRIDAAGKFSERYPNDSKVMYILWFEAVGASSEMKDGLSKFHRNAREDITQIIQEAKDLNEISTNIDPDAFALFFTSTLFGLAYQHVVNPKLIDFASLMESVKQQALVLLNPS